MFIAHLPAGYLLSTSLRPRLLDRHHDARLFVLAGMIGAIAPDFDLAYFYLVDHRQHHHHTYFTHLPLSWALLIVFFAIARRAAAARDRRWPTVGLFFALNGFGHLLLDSIVGGIWWLGPWIDQPFSLFTIHRRVEPWWLNFVLNPSFVLEIVLVVVALGVFCRSTRKKRSDE